MAEDSNEAFVYQGSTRDPLSKRPRGRPAGSKAKVVLELDKAVDNTPPAARLPDIGVMVANQLRLLEATQNRYALDVAGGSISCKAIAELSRAMASAMDSVERATKAQNAILARLSEAQHVEAAIRRIASQEPAVMRYAMRQLKAVLDGEKSAVAEVSQTASDAITALHDD